MQSFIKKIDERQLSVMVWRQIAGQLFRQIVARELDVLRACDLVDEGVAQRRDRAAQLLVHRGLQCRQLLLRRTFIWRTINTFNFTIKLTSNWVRGNNSAQSQNITLCWIKQKGLASQVLNFRLQTYHIIQRGYEFDTKTQKFDNGTGLNLNFPNLKWP